MNDWFNGRRDMNAKMFESMKLKRLGYIEFELREELDKCSKRPKDPAARGNLNSSKPSCLLFSKLPTPGLRKRRRHDNAKPKLRIHLLTKRRHVDRPAAELGREMVGVWVWEEQKIGKAVQNATGIQLRIPRANCCTAQASGLARRTPALPVTSSSSAAQTQNHELTAHTRGGGCRWEEALRIAAETPWIFI
ncbi:hypothetical protein K402DRAFT_129891 [Aulographum hederae CBS 113979]|uniref:Uncharacterized protein n=1 Tax=Aulographum hederae CBS 113979 TaxID=1176131 RepID=A0A6G1HEX7_9PEZI|nr:hypothetical protein K402DRAFT_129891 [Aulographum hederae CBS 113979]